MGKNSPIELTPNVAVIWHLSLTPLIGTFFEQRKLNNEEMN